MTFKVILGHIVSSSLETLFGGGENRKKKRKKKEILKSRIEFWREILLSFKIYMGAFLNLLKLSLRKGKGDFFFK